MRSLPLHRAALAKVVGSVRSVRRHGDEAALPSAVGIEVADACNLACAVCSRELDWDRRATPFLDLDRFVRFYDPIRPPYLSLSGYGEPLLVKALPEMVAYATQRGSRVQVITNGTRLDPDHADALLDAGVARLKVSVDAVDPELYARLRDGGELQVVLANVERLIAMRDARRLPGPTIELQMVLFAENVHQAEPLLELCASRFTGVTASFLPIFTYGDRAPFLEKRMSPDPVTLATLARAEARARALGMRRAATLLRGAQTELTEDLSHAPCFVPWYACMLSTDGDLYACCYHTVRGRRLGNVLETPFAELWNGPAMVEFRRQLLEDRASDPVCATCHYEETSLARALRWSGGR